MRILFFLLLLCNVAHAEYSINPHTGRMDKTGSGSSYSSITQDGNGNIGINTVSPAAQLDVNGSIRTSGTADSVFNGNVGIGVTVPANELEVDGSVYATTRLLVGTNSTLARLNVSASDASLVRFTDTEPSATTAGASVQLYSSDGAALVQFDRLGIFTFGGSYETSANVSAQAAIGAYTAENWGAGARGAYISLEGTSTGSTTRTKWVYIRESNVGIGSSSPTVKLDVVGTIKGTGYQSSDGTAGATVTTCTGFKNGLCISGT